MEDETVWLTQAQLVELYQTSQSNISEHIKHIFAEGELAKDSVVRNFRTTAADGKTYQMDYYNLDVIATAVQLRADCCLPSPYAVSLTCRLEKVTFN